MALKEFLSGEQTIREALLGSEGLYEMANVPARDIDQKFDVWLDSLGKSRNVSHHVPRLKVEFEKGTLVPVSIEDPPKIFSDRKYNGNGVSSLLKFLGTHSVALLLHYNAVWSDPQILRYLTLVGRRHKTIPEALQIMLDDGDIDEIPKEFNL